MQEIKIVLDMDKLEEEINELKLEFIGDNMSTHNILKENGYTIIEMVSGDGNLGTDKHLFYGREIDGKIYLVYMQHFAPVEYYLEQIDFYGEFISKGTILF